MTSDLHQLARANPVAEPYGTDPSADDALLRRVLLEAASPTPAPTRRRRHLVLAPMALALVVLAVFALAPGGGTDPVRHLAGAERAYAAVLPGGDVIHEVVTSEWSVPGKPGGRERYEAWYRPSTGEAVRITGGDEGAVRVMIARDGTVLVERADTLRGCNR